MKNDDLEDLDDSVSEKTTKPKYSRENFYQTAKYANPNLNKQIVSGCNYANSKVLEKSMKNINGLYQQKEYSSTTNLHQFSQ